MGGGNQNLGGAAVRANPVEDALKWMLAPQVTPEQTDAWFNPPTPSALPAPPPEQFPVGPGMHNLRPSLMASEIGGEIKDILNAPVELTKRAMDPQLSVPSRLAAAAGAIGAAAQLDPLLPRGGRGAKMKEPPPQAAEMGPVKITGYHGTRTDFNKAEGFGGIHLGTELAANQRLEQHVAGRIRGIPGLGDKVQKLETILNKPYGSIEKPITETELFSLVNIPKELRNLRDQGYDGIIYRNSREDRGSISAMAFDVGQVRKVSELRTGGTTGPLLVRPHAVEPPPPGAGIQYETTKAKPDVVSTVPSRATESPTVYHVTDKQFTEFDPTKGGSIGIHFGNAEQAANIKQATGKEARIIPAKLDIKNPLVLEQDLIFQDPQSLALKLREKGVLTPEEVKGLRPQFEDVQARRDTARFDDDPRLMKAVNQGHSAIQRLLQSKGYDGIIYPNAIEGKGNSYAVFDPKQIKQEPPPQGAGIQYETTKAKPDVVSTVPAGETQLSWAPEGEGKFNVFKENVHTKVEVDPEGNVRLRGVVVKQGERGRGAGRDFVEKLVSDAAQQFPKAKEAVIWAFPTEQGFWQKVGFKPTGAIAEAGTIGPVAELRRPLQPPPPGAGIEQAGGQGVKGGMSEQMRVFIGKGETLKGALAEDENSIFLSHPSAKEKGKIQVTEYRTENGKLVAVGDSQFDSYFDVKREFRDRNYQSLGGKHVENAFNAIDPESVKDLRILTPEQEAEGFAGSLYGY